MGRGLDERELRRRAIEGVRDEVEAFGSAAPDSLLIRREGLLAEARSGGLSSASLQASRAGAPLYERIGFRDLGFIEMWEMRR